ncbi:hypothetical protein F6V30_14345 [Oryzomonas sagensis]|uniref:Uncharacterized protein n=1 Tax=Oryzomonas sagensis TaxID=2603857 RepID=A0ABQ6TL97_9BACT|nr:hypothetical protein [Oryzomonas sagensis]KAB0669013.1 hypothetical protein F6V30_14345 [Oryzomonas sagensis]
MNIEIEAGAVETGVHHEAWLAWMTIEKIVRRHIGYKNDSDGGVIDDEDDCLGWICERFIAGYKPGMLMAEYISYCKLLTKDYQRKERVRKRYAQLSETGDDSDLYCLTSAAGEPSINDHNAAEIAIDAESTAALLLQLGYLSEPEYCAYLDRIMYEVEGVDRTHGTDWRTIEAKIERFRSDFRRSETLGVPLRGSKRGRK